jgi:hypothetical protein
LTITSHSLYFKAMKLCQKCKKEISQDIFIGRQSQCPVCSADLHCCLNCTFYDTVAYNNCLETQAERVLEKSRSNFCDFFNFKLSQKNTGKDDFNAKNRLEALFNKNI